MVRSQSSSFGHCRGRLEAAVFRYPTIVTWVSVAFVALHDTAFFVAAVERKEPAAERNRHLGYGSGDVREKLPYIAISEMYGFAKSSSNLHQERGWRKKAKYVQGSRIHQHLWHGKLWYRKQSLP